MADRPEDFPEWALVEETDPVSGQSNIVEPPESYKNSGWTRAQIPPRQWFNWLLRRIYDWLFYLDDERAEIRKEEDERYARLVTRNWFETEGLSGTFTLSSGTRAPACWGDNGFVCVFNSGSDSRSAQSDAGDYWVTGDLPNTYNWRAVGYSDGFSLYVAGGYDTGISGDSAFSVSADGNSWSTPVVVADMFVGQVVGANLFGTDYLIAAGSNPEPIIAWSDDAGTTWASYEVGSGLTDIVIVPNGRTDAEGRLVAAVKSGSTSVTIYGFTSATDYSEIGSFSSPDLSSAPLGAVPAIEYDDANGLYVLIAYEDPGSGTVIRAYTSENASSWAMVKELPNISNAKLLYAPDLHAMLIYGSGAGELYVTTDYANFPRLNWTPGGDSGTGYPAIAWSPRYRNFVALASGNTSTDTITLRSL